MFNVTNGVTFDLFLQLLRFAFDIVLGHATLHVTPHCLGHATLHLTPHSLGHATLQLTPHSVGHATLQLVPHSGTRNTPADTTLSGTRITPADTTLSGTRHTPADTTLICPDLLRINMTFRFFSYVRKSQEICSKESCLTMYNVYEI